MISVVTQLLYKHGGEYKDNLKPTALKTGKDTTK